MKPFDSLQSFREDAPLFILPTIFSRFDNPIDYHYKDGPKSRDGNSQASRGKDLSVIQAFRKSRGHLPIFVSWEDATPSEPHEVILNSVKVYPGSQQQLLEELKKCFQLKPIWSRNALLHKLKCNHMELKTLLPTVAYYFPNGPFRCQWVRYGYDPRKNKSSKIFQTLDFRRKQPMTQRDSAEISLGKRHTYDTTPVRKRESLKKVHDSQRFILDSSLLSLQPGSSSKESEKPEIDYERLQASYVFTPGVLPPFRQVHYQLNDIKVDAVQKLVHSNDNNEPEVCHDKDGWCGEGVIDQIRCILTLLTDEMTNKDSHLSEAPYFDDGSPNHEFFEDEYLDYYNTESP